MTKFDSNYQDNHRHRGGNDSVLMVSLLKIRMLSFLIARVNISLRILLKSTVDHCAVVDLG